MNCQLIETDTLGIGELVALLPLLTCQPDGHLYYIFLGPSAKPSNALTTTFISLSYTARGMDVHLENWRSGLAVQMQNEILV
jgi:hypothetical protein